MAHPMQHCKSSVKKWGGQLSDYQPIHDWFDETKAWIGHSKHRMFRHHSEGIFECEKYLELILSIQMVKLYIQDMLVNNM
jgi:hypothetical protein